MRVQGGVVLAQLLITGILCREVPYPNNVERSSEHWEKQNAEWLDKTLKREQTRRTAKNVIVFVGDGMGMTSVTAGRIFNGQNKQLQSEHAPLAWERFPYAGLSKTYCLDHHVTDSAAAATALFCGVKTAIEAVGVSPDVPDFADCRYNSHAVDSMAAWAIAAGKWAGFVTTHRVTDATPAALFAHSVNRNLLDDSLVAANEDNLTHVADCVDIARQLIERAPGKDFRVILGGGRKQFMPNTTLDPEPPEDPTHDQESGNRLDGKNLISQFQNGNGNRHYVWSRQQMLEVDANSADYLLGLFDSGHMEYQLRHDSDGRTDNPSISEMTTKALEILQRGDDGFLLMVEGARIDYGWHANSAKLALTELAELEKAVEAALQMVDTSETLIVVTADHSHSVSIIGYPPRTVPILGQFPGKLWGMSDGLPSTVLVFANGPNSDNGTTRANLTGVDTEADDFLQPTYMLTPDDTHAGEDVPVYAVGPWSHLFTGSIDNTHIAHAVSFAMCAGPAKGQCEAAAKEAGSSSDGGGLPLLLFALILVVVLITLLFFVTLNLLHERRKTERAQSRVQPDVSHSNMTYTADSTC